jgi:hypothetical protein
MPAGTILVVHGTGVRLEHFGPAFDQATILAGKSGIESRMVACPWGDLLGSTFKGDSLPDGPGPEARQAEEEDLLTWGWLFDDPLFELETLAIPERAVSERGLGALGRRNWREVLDRVRQYRPNEDVTLLLENTRLDRFWADAWSQIVERSDVPDRAFAASAHVLADACHALARAVVAEMHRRALADGMPLPRREVRKSLVELLRRDWYQDTFGIGKVFARLLARAATPAIRRQRGDLNELIAFPIGDILLYQARSAGVHGYLRGKIAAASPPVVLMAHSLGGIACFDLLCSNNPPEVAGLITFGTQVPMLYEMGALVSLKPPMELPQGFPRWLNVFDRNDFLSFVANRLFASAQDVEVVSGQPFPFSHSSYLNNIEFWEATRSFLAGLRE